jgi:hypothetical protein
MLAPLAAAPLEEATEMGAAENGARLLRLRERVPSRVGSMDVLGLDVTWIAGFAEAGLILEWTGADRDAALDDILFGPLETMTWDDRVYAVAANTNVQLLWYRKDLVPAPAGTWDASIIGRAGPLGARDWPAQGDVGRSRWSRVVTVVQPNRVYSGQ